MTYEVLSEAPPEQELTITLEKQREIALWAVGKTAEEIEQVASTIGLDRSVIARWRRKYVDEAHTPQPPPESPEVTETAATTQETNGMGKETEGPQKLSEDKKIELAKWSLDKTDKEINDKLREYGYSGGGMVYHWRKKYLPKEKVPTKRGWKPEEREALAKEYLAVGSEDAWERKHPDIASGMVRRWMRELGMDKARDPNWRSQVQPKGPRQPQPPQRYVEGSAEKIYTPEFKRYALDLAEARAKAEGVTFAQVAKSLDIPSTNFARWRRDLGLPPSPRSAKILTTRAASGAATSANMKLPPRPRGLGPEPKRFTINDRGIQTYSEEFMRYALDLIDARARQGVVQSAVAKELGIDGSTFSDFRRRLGITVQRGGKAMRVTRHGALRTGALETLRTKVKQAPEPEPVWRDPIDLLAPEDRALLTNHEAQKTAKRDEREEVRKLRAELAVKNGMLALAYQQGFLRDLLDVESMFRRSK